ncbi:MAG: SGNH/GDSL hydrolase family protein [Planctomycetes bacterium]|nr:SGNH/GDSL hydrolase family protein [Planctomycetota bacterium]
MAVRLALAAGAPLLLLALAEFVVASLDVAPFPEDPIVVWNGPRDREMNSPRGEFRHHPNWLWEPRPGVIVFGAPINEGGYRGPYYPPRKGARLRIATLGDSSTYGFNVAEDVCWSRCLEAILRAYGCDVEVLNFGVIGFTAVQGERLYLGRVRDYQPDVVVAAFGAVNEAFTTLPGLTDLEKIARVSSFGYRLRQFLLRYDFFRLLDSLGGKPAEAAPPEAPGTAERVAPEVFEQTLVDLNRAVTADGGRLILVSPPRRQDGVDFLKGKGDEYTAAIHRVAEREQIPLADVLAEFRRLDREALGEGAESLPRALESELFTDGWHPSLKGHRAYAVVVGQALRDAGLLPFPPEDG